MSGESGMLTSHTGMKVISAVLIAGLIDKYYFNELEMKHNLVFAVSTAAGIGLGSIIGAQVPNMTSSQYINGKTVVQRSLELVFGAGVGYAGFRISNLDYNPSEMSKRILSVLITNVAAEYASDYLSSEKLSYLE